MFARSLITALAVAGAVVAQTTVYQAELAKLSGVTVGNSVAGFTGMYD